MVPPLQLCSIFVCVSLSMWYDFKFWKIVFSYLLVVGLLGRLHASCNSYSILSYLNYTCIFLYLNSATKIVILILANKRRTTWQRCDKWLFNKSYQTSWNEHVISEKKIAKEWLNKLYDRLDPKRKKENKKRKRWFEQI